MRHRTSFELGEIRTFRIRLVLGFLVFAGVFAFVPWAWVKLAAGLLAIAFNLGLLAYYSDEAIYNRMRSQGYLLEPFYERPPALSWTDLSTRDE